MKAFDIAMRMPWAITDDALEGMLEIAARENLSPAAVEAKLGRPLDNTRTVTVRDGVATIPVMGPIFRYADLFTEICGATSIDTLARDFNAALDNGQVRSIVFQIDSPGGEVNGTSEFASMIYNARGQKPITAYVADLGCSAAYWIASACDEIVVADTATVGSIGVVAAMRKPNSDKETSVQFVSSQSPDKRPDISTEKGRATIQKQVDSLADVFVTAVARNRGVSEDTVLADFGQGGVMIGQEAVEAGLADRVGTYEGTLTRAANPMPSTARHTAHTIDPEPGIVIDPISLDADITPPFIDPAVESTAQTYEENDTMAEPNTDLTASELDELRTRIAALEQERNEASAERDRFSAEAATAAERVQSLERENSLRELAALAEGWYGSTDEHVAFMEGLTPDAREFYVRTQNAQAEQLNSSKLFEAVGVTGSEAESSDLERLNGLATAEATEKGISYTDAMQRVVAADPSLYNAYRKSITG